MLFLGWVSQKVPSSEDSLRKVQSFDCVSRRSGFKSRLCNLLFGRIHNPSVWGYMQSFRRKVCRANKRSKEGGPTPRLSEQDKSERPSFPLPHTPPRKVGTMPLESVNSPPCLPVPVVQDIRLRGASWPHPEQLELWMFMSTLSFPPCSTCVPMGHQQVTPCLTHFMELTLKPSSHQESGVWVGD